MEVNRRHFIRLLLSVPIAAELDIEKLLWIPNRSKIFIPHPKQIAFFEFDLPVSLYGILYHMSDYSTNIWLGLLREPYPFSEIHKIVTKKLRDK